LSKPSPDSDSVTQEQDHNQFDANDDRADLLVFLAVIVSVVAGFAALWLSPTLRWIFSSISFG